MKVFNIFVILVIISQIHVYSKWNTRINDKEKLDIITDNNIKVNTLNILSELEDSYGLYIVFEKEIKRILKLLPEHNNIHIIELCSGNNNFKNFTNLNIITSDKHQGLDLYIDMLNFPDNMTTDIYLSILCLHHFDINQINSIIKVLLEHSNKGIIFIDIKRSFLGSIISFISGLIFNNINISIDGFISFRKGYTRSELESQLHYNFKYNEFEYFFYSLYISKKNY